MEYLQEEQDRVRAQEPPDRAVPRGPTIDDEILLLAAETHLQRALPAIQVGQITAADAAAIRRLAIEAEDELILLLSP